MGEKRYADACAAFEKSNKLDPGIGTQLNIAKCYEEWGKIGRAFLAYRDAEKMAQGRERPARAEDPRARRRARPAGAAPDDQAPQGCADRWSQGHARRRAGHHVRRAVRHRSGPAHDRVHGCRAARRRRRSFPVERGGDSEVTLDIPKAARSSSRSPTLKPDAKPTPARCTTVEVRGRGAAGTPAATSASVASCSAVQACSRSACRAS